MVDNKLNVITKNLLLDNKKNSKIELYVLVTKK